MIETVWRFIKAWWWIIPAAVPVLLILSFTVVGIAIMIDIARHGRGGSK